MPEGYLGSLSSKLRVGLLSSGPLSQTQDLKISPRHIDRRICCQLSSTDDRCQLIHDLRLRSYLYHCVWSVTTARNLTPEKRDNNYSPHPLTATSCQQHSTYNWHLSLLWVSVMELKHALVMTLYFCPVVSFYLSFLFLA